MWYPNRGQWIVIWLFAVCGLSIWTLGSPEGSAATRFAVSLLAIGALLVWRLSRKTERRAREPAFAVMPEGVDVSADFVPAPIPELEPRSLNPLTVLSRCFSWRGRFTRGEFAVAYAANLALVFVLAVIAGLTFGTSTEPSPFVQFLPFVMFLIWFPHRPRRDRSPTQRPRYVALVASRVVRANPQSRTPSRAVLRP